MSYKPNYCCQCGEKIERINWNLKSRRFCELCETDFKIYDWLPRIALGGGITLAILGFGSYWMRPAKSVHTVPNQFISSSQNLNRDTIKPPNTNNQTLLPKPESNQKQPTSQQNSTPKAKPVLSSPSQPQETVYFCGAQTKKGTPCSRRIKERDGRCWQHPGQAAMLPSDKLVANQ
ncbi:MAG: hypothetical protein M3Q78_02590 [Acidobacteriota bacterium]|nr:hypothetical protein [Acidobacteriota bacterium]